jgi:hypothetical protein
MNRLLAVLAVVLSVLNSGCSGSGETSEPFDSLTFLPNEGVYLSYSGDSFTMNLMFHAPKSFGTGAAKVQDVRLFPDSNTVRQSSYEVRDSDPGPSVLRKHLAIGLRASKPGEHTFTEVELRREGKARRFPLGTLRVKVEDGSSAGLFALLEGGGVHPAPYPLTFSLRNTTPEAVVVKDVLVSHPRIHVERSQISVDGQRIPAGGFAMQPEQLARIRVDWSIDFPSRLANVEARPLLAIQRQKGTDYVGLHNMVFRYDPEWEATRRASKGGA